MSGRKCTTIRLDAAREKTRKSLAKIARDLRTAEGVRLQLSTALEGASDGLLQHFAGESNRARVWIEKLNALVATADTLTLASADDQVERRKREVGSIVQEGLGIQSRLAEAFVQQAGKLRAEGAGQLFALKSLLSRGREPISKWGNREFVDLAECKVIELQEQLEMDHLGEVKEGATVLTGEIERELQSAEENAGCHEQRVYVLKALRQVCADMGFTEVSPPSREVESDPKSRIRLIVDTINRGRVTFFLSLDAIESDSCITDSHCFEEFGRLSEQLTESFGVLTEFKMADGTALPKLKRQGERDEPTGATRDTNSIG